MLFNLFDFGYGSHEQIRLRGEHTATVIGSPEAECAIGVQCYEEVGACALE